MKLNLLTVTSLLCGLFLLGSCAKDEPQGNTKKEQSIAGGPLVSIALDMDVAVAEFNEPEAKAQEGRAFTSPQTPVTVKEGRRKSWMIISTPYLASSRRSSRCSVKSSSRIIRRSMSSCTLSVARRWLT